MGTEPHQPQAVREDRLDDVVTTYLQALDAGTEPDRADLLQRNPDIASNLRDFFLAQDELLEKAAPLQPVARAARLELVDTEILKLTLEPADHTGKSPELFAVGDYEVLEEIAEGGMGVVYKARHRKSQKIVALKVLVAGRFSRPSDLERFRNETQIVAELDHPNILPIYEVGEHDQLPFLAMKLMEGGNLTAQLERYRTDPRRAAHLVANLARAVHYAHQRGILHRDLKPDNVLLDKDGEPQLTDFGLAKWIEKDAGLSVPGTILGTPAYMAPEQTRGGREDVTVAADIYSTGAILYALLTGQPPFRGDFSLEILKNVQEKEPERPGLRNPKVDHDLETICLNCLRKDPNERYESAQALSEDLDRWLDGRPIKARPMGPVERAWRWLRRHPLAASLTAITVASLATASWLGFDTRRKDGELERKVNLALDKAGRSLTQGRWGEASEAVGQAETFSSTMSAAARDRVAPRLVDQRMLVQLEDIRINHLDIDEGGLSLLRPGPRYAAAFREYGVEIEGKDPAAVAREIKARRVRSSLVAALDHWAQSSASISERQHLRKIADAADDEKDAMPRRLRHALDTTNKDALIQIASEPGVETSAPSTIVSLATGLRERGAAELEAQLLRTAQKLHPGDFWINLELGTALLLSRPGEPRDALPFFTAALALSDGNPAVYVYLGNAQVKAGKLEEAETAYRQAIALKPNFVLARINLGYVLNELGRLVDAEKMLGEAVRLDPASFLAYYNLGLNLQRQGKNAQAAESYHKAVSLKPDYAEAFNNYGNALTSLRQAGEALEAFDKALAIRPGYARAHFNRGYLLDQMGRFDEAIDSYRQAIQYKQDYAEAHYQIAFDLLYQKGKFAQAEAELQSGLKFVKPGDPKKSAWDQLLVECNRLLKLQPRLDAYLKGQIKPANAAEACELAVLCAWPSHELYAEAAGLFERAFAMEPALAGDLGQGYRYYAAGCAARAGCGESRDKLTAAERSQRLARALEWLRADLALRTEQIGSGKPVQAAEATAKLGYWQTDPNLACVRDTQRLDRMPERERNEWQDLWREIAAMAQR